MLFVELITRESLEKKPPYCKCYGFELQTRFLSSTVERQAAVKQETLVLPLFLYLGMDIFAAFKTLSVKALTGSGERSKDSVTVSKILSQKWFQLALLKLTQILWDIIKWCLVPR